MAVLMRKYTSKKDKQIKPTCSHALYILAQGHHSSWTGSVMPKGTQPLV